MTAGATASPGAVPRDGAAGRGARALYAAVRGVLVVVARLYWRTNVVGREHLPAAGPYILAPVHRSIVDTLVLATVTRRRLRYMGKQELWANRFGSWFLDALGGFPVARGGADREALRRSAAVLEGGEPLVIFPEGTRRFGEEVADLYEGAAYLAARERVPIVPVGLAGTAEVMPKGSKMVRPGRIEIVIGPPLPPPGHDGDRVPRRVVSETTEGLRGVIQGLFDEARSRRARRLP